MLKTMNCFHDRVLKCRQEDGRKLVIIAVCSFQSRSVIKINYLSARHEPVFYEIVFIWL